MTRNPHLIAMPIIGAVLVIVGTILGADAIAAAGQERSYAGFELGAGIGVTVIGTVLLILAWAIAAARWTSRRPDEYVRVEVPPRG